MLGTKHMLIASSRRIVIETQAKAVSRRSLWTTTLKSLSAKNKSSARSHDSCQHRAMSSTNFGSSSYAACFGNLPVPDVDAFRKETLAYLEGFDKQAWYNDPMTTILNGEKFQTTENDLVETKDAFGETNGLQQLASKEQVEALIEAIQAIKSPSNDLREPLRKIELELLTTYAGELIGNQCMDFGKQDGVTEMEEATMANAVERRLNDLLLQNEKDGKLEINRRPIYVSCVSNFTHFLDLFRKTVRSLELGTPCIILGRSNTSQHSYRWAELLVNLLKEHDLQHMVTFLSCSLEDIKIITAATKNSTGNLYATCSRDLAQQITSGFPNTIASTGGPNTLVTTEWTPEVQAAIRMSATIESSGQCTALRHCVVSNHFNEADILPVFAETRGVSQGPEALSQSMFDGVFKCHEGTKGPGEDEKYTYLPGQDTYIKFNEGLPSEEIEEYWRKVVVDFSELENGWETDENELHSLAKWLNKNQPISLAVNAKRAEVFKLGRALFEQTGLVVYTVGSTDHEQATPALTTQARPQEAEIFGEFPPRDSLQTHTKFPMFVPSSTPSYDTVYSSTYLETVEPVEDIPQRFRDLVMHVQDKAKRGYCFEILNYLYDATQNNPKRGFGTSRTALWGLQRPPIMSGSKTLIRCQRDISFDDLAPVLALFTATNAYAQFELSVNGDNHEILAVAKENHVPILVHTEDEFILRKSNSNLVYNSVDIQPQSRFPMVANFVSLYMPMGHIKSTMPDDEEFVAAFSDSDKWLKMLL